MSIETIITDIPKNFNLPCSDNSDMMKQMCTIVEQLVSMQHIYEHFISYCMHPYTNHVVYKCISTCESRKIWGVQHDVSNFMLGDRRHNKNPVIDAILLRDLNVQVFKDKCGILLTGTRYLKDVLTNYTYYRVVTLLHDPNLYVIRLDAVVKNFIVLYINQLLNAQDNIRGVLKETLVLCKVDRKHLIALYEHKLQLLTSLLGQLQIKQDLEYSDIIEVKSLHDAIFSRLYRQYLLNISLRDMLLYIVLYIQDIPTNTSRISSTSSLTDFYTFTPNKLLPMTSVCFNRHTKTSIVNQYNKSQPKYNDHLFSFNLYSYVINCGLTVPTPSHEDHYLLDAICDPACYLVHSSVSSPTTYKVVILADVLNKKFDSFLSMFYNSMHCFASLYVLHFALFE
jgi:hypothetical protein